MYNQRNTLRVEENLQINLQPAGPKLGYNKNSTQKQAAMGGINSSPLIYGLKSADISKDTNPGFNLNLTKRQKTNTRVQIIESKSVSSTSDIDSEDDGKKTSNSVSKSLTSGLNTGQRSLASSRVLNNFAGKAIKAVDPNRKTWIEMKFDKETPSCRTMHAQITYQERLFIYGGTDLKDTDANTE